jgi:hypothetical protein
MLQLRPILPVTVTSKDDAKGWAYFLIDEGDDHHLMWVVVLDASGEVWVVPNPEIRVRKNWTLGRR